MHVSPLFNFVLRNYLCICNAMNALFKYSYANHGTINQQKVIYRSNDPTESALLICMSWLLQKLLVAQLVQDIPRPLSNKKIYYHTDMNLPLVCTPNQMKHVLSIKILFLKLISSFLHLFLQIFQLKFCVHFSYLSYVLHSPLIPSSLIWSL